MPVSFWIFLIVCFVSFILVIKDHDEAWKEYRESKGNARYKKGVHLFALWFVPFFSLIGTLFLGFESFKSDEKDTQRDTQFRDVTNRLAKTETKYNDATNALAAAKQAAIDAQSASREASTAASKIPKSRVLSNEAVVRIAEKMMFVKPISIRVVIESREDDPAQLASQLARIVGFRGVNTVDFINNLNEQIIGFKINTKSPPDDSLANALSQIFTEIGQAPDISTNANLNVDLEIVVGGRL